MATAFRGYRFLRVLLIVLLAALAIYVVDYALLRFRHSQFGTVTVHRYYRIPLKSGRVELDYDGDYQYPCVYSLFPHLGDPPCWYLNRHTNQWVDVQSGTPNNPHVF